MRLAYHAPCGRAALWLVGLAIGTLGAVTTGHAAVSVQDFTGHTVHLDQPAQRIVALTPHLVENLFTAGLGDRVVGASRYSDYPPSARRIARVGGYGSFSLEAIVARRPDLVVAWAEGGTHDLIGRLRGLGIPVYVDDPTRFEDITREIRDLGRLGGTSSTAEAAADRFQLRMAGLGRRYGGRRPVSVFYAVSVDPLITVSDDSMIDAAITTCGGRNVYADAAGASPQVGMESLIARNPEAIVEGRPGGRDDGWQRVWQRWPALAAVAGQRFVTVARSAISRPTVRMADATATLCRGLDRIRQTIGGNQAALSGASTTR